MTAHTVTYEATRYPGSALAQRITYRCACGKCGQIEDGPLGCDMKRAKAAHARHVRVVTR